MSDISRPPIEQQKYIKCRRGVLVNHRLTDLAGWLTGLLTERRDFWHLHNVPSKDQSWAISTQCLAHSQGNTAAQHQDVT